MEGDQFAQQPLKPAVFQITVVIPAYNEASNLPGLLRRISESAMQANLNYRILVVDDGSSDATAQLLATHSSQMPLRIIRHEVNQGLGVTIRDGLREAAREARDQEVIVTMDADETQPPECIERMVKMIANGHDVVIASRYQPGARVEGLSLHREWISQAASILMRFLFPTSGVRDYTCGYRAYRAETLSRAFQIWGEHFVDQQGFQCMVDILLKLRKLNLVFGEVPLVLRYDLKKGSSKMKLVRTSINTLCLLVRRKFEE